MTELTQFRILVRTSRGRLLESAVASRGIDGPQFVIWSFALIATPPFFFAVRMMSKYAFLWRQPDLLERVALADRLFFIVYSMLAAALLAAMSWEALFPDREDQEILGVLPVRPRTVAAARLAAAMQVATAFTMGLALLSGLAYALNVAAGFRSASIVGAAPLVLAGHMIALTLAGVFTFAVLLALRAVAVAVVGAEATQRAATVLQLLTTVAIVEALIFLPELLEQFAARVHSHGAATLAPPLWFASLYAVFGGPPVAAGLGLAWLALAATGAALLSAFVTYVAPAAWMARRTREARLRSSIGRTIGVAARLATPGLRQPAARATFAFTLASLVRSRRHALMIASYMGAAIAVAAIRLAAAEVHYRGLRVDAPADFLLALPLIITFFLVAALHAAFGVPTDVEGNWTFRVAHPRSASFCVDALPVALLVMAVLPVSCAWLLVSASLWGPWDAAAAAIMHAASGAALVELSLLGCRSIPFTRPHVASTRTIRGDWILGILALHVFAFRLDDVQLAALASPAGVAVYVAVMVLVTGAARARRRAGLDGKMLDFDAPEADAPATLNLSQATG